MATVSERLALIINFNGDAAIKGLDGVAKKAEGAHEDTRKLGDSLTKMGAIGLAASGVAAAGLAKLAMGASDLNEVTSKSKVLFGQASGAVEKFAAGAARSLGQSQVAALEAATSFANLGRLTGMGGQELARFSTSLTTLAGDLASFNNSSPEEAVMALGAALRGESEPIRRFGVMLDEATLKQRALDMGLIQTTSGTLPPAIKMQAAYAEIMAQTTAAQGDFARTADGAANQQRILKAELKNLADGIGSGVLPAFKAIVSGASNAVGAFNGLSAETKTLIGQFAAGGAGVTAAVSGISLVAGQAIKMKERFTSAEGGLNGFGKASVAAGAAVAGLSLVMIALNRRSEEAKLRVSGLRDTMKDLGVTADVAATRQVLKLVHNTERVGQAMDKAGVSTEQLRAAVIDGGASYDEVRRKLEAYMQAEVKRGQVAGESTGANVAAARGLIAEIDKQRAAVATLTAETEKQRKADEDLLPVKDQSIKTIGEHRRAVQDDLDMVAENTKRQQDHEQALKDSEEALKDLTGAQEHARSVRQAAYDDVRAQTDKEFGFARAQRDTRDAARDLAEKVKAATDAKGKDAEKNDEAMAASDALALQILEEAHAYAESTGAVDGSRDSIDKQVLKLGELRDQYAEKFPQIAAQIDTYIGKLREAANASTTLVVPGFETNYHGKRAAGGPVSARQTYLVGEKGPELFMPDGPGRIIPNDQTAAAMGSGGGGVVINAHFNGITDSRAVARELGREFAWRLKVGA